MFINFAGIMINTDYIISIYKTREHDKYFEVNIKLYPTNIPIKEIYTTKEEQETRFTAIIAEIDNYSGRNKNK